MHCCKAGQKDALAQQASKDLDLLVVAPSDNVSFTTEKHKDGKEYSYETGVVNGGGWVIYYKGEKMNSFSGSTPPVFDNPEQVIKRYEEEYDCFIVVDSIGIDDAKVSHAFTIKSQKNIVGDCLNSEFCIVRS